MKFPGLLGVMRRRVLMNYRVDPGVAARLVPAPLRPKLVGGAALAGVCLLRLEAIRPRHLPAFVGIGSENAAHRIAVVWDDDEAGARREGVYIPRRDSDSWLNCLVGGRLFPGEHNRADFAVLDRPDRLTISMRSRDGAVAVEVVGAQGRPWTGSSVFGSLDEASAFFAGGSLGFSATAAGDHLDGVRLRTERWSVEPLAIEHAHSSFFADEHAFPPGSVTFDSALLMRSIELEWRSEPSLALRAATS